MFITEKNKISLILKKLTGFEIGALIGVVVIDGICICVAIYDCISTDSALYTPSSVRHQIFESISKIEIWQSQIFNEDKRQF